MSKSKGKVSQGDAARVLLTEILPYEIPLRFSNLHFYSLAHENQPPDGIISLISQWARNESPDFEPYCYWIQQGQSKKRNLGLIHPLLYSDICSFYSKNAQQVISLCSKSEWSLRHPQRVASVYYDRVDVEDGDGENIEGAESGVEIGLTQTKASSYFSYWEFNFLWKFFESKKILGLERSFVSYRWLDISKCFSSIYTHSVSWAINTRAVAKAQKHSETSFSAILDRTMRRASSGETHGILVGSEFSRIFAEILLQEIDSNVKRAISGTNLVEGRDFSVFRYIDDYFIFFNQPAVADLVQKLLEDELFQYKLFLNENKRTESRRPFVTSISIVKAVLRKLVAEELDLSTWKRKTFRQRGELLRRIRRTLIEHQVDYSEISSFLMSDILRRVSVFKKAVPEKLDSESIVSFLNCAVELCFFIFSVDVRFRTSVLLAQLLHALEAISKRHGIPSAIELQEIVFRESLGCLRGLRVNGEEQSIELANILMGIERFAASRRIPEALLLKLWFPRDDSSFAFNYFNAIPIIYFCKNSPEFFKLKVKVVEGSIARILEAESVVKSTEFFCFALDLISCPFVLHSMRRKLTARICKEVEMKSKTIDECFLELSSRQWLFDWSTDISTEMFLSKKEFSFTY